MLGYTDQCGMNIDKWTTDRLKTSEKMKIKSITTEVMGSVCIYIAMDKKLHSREHHCGRCQMYRVSVFIVNY